MAGIGYEHMSDGGWLQRVTVEVLRRPQELQATQRKHLRGHPLLCAAESAIRRRCCVVWPRG